MTIVFSYSGISRYRIILLVIAFLKLTSFSSLLTLFVHDSNLWSWSDSQISGIFCFNCHYNTIYSRPAFMFVDVLYRLRHTPKQLHEAWLVSPVFTKEVPYFKKDAYDSSRNFQYEIQQKSFFRLKEARQHTVRHM